MQDVSELLLDLENRVRRAVLEMPRRRPWVEDERREIVEIAKRCLGFREEWVPTVHTTVAGAEPSDGVVVERLQATTWDGCHGAAHLFLPRDGARDKLPLVILCCGHGQGGKQAVGYQQMAWRLAHFGAAVLVPDNLGQGERVPMGHADVLGPFAGGISLQGLIVMETAGWLRWGQADGRFDRSRIAAIGNSGGGTLTMFLGALFRDELAALSSSGYPSTFEFIALKEKKHCHCNLVPGVVGQIEMWQLFGCFAPRPLFLFQGKGDWLFPEDLFETNARKSADAYRHLGAAERFDARVFAGEHKWDDPRREALGQFVATHLGLDAARPVPPLPSPFANCFPTWPTSALTTDRLSAQLTGVRGVHPEALYQIYAPELQSTSDVALRRVGARQFIAQVNAFLTREAQRKGVPS